MDSLRLKHLQSHGVCSVRHVNGICIIPSTTKEFDEVRIWSPLGPTIQKWRMSLGAAPFVREGPGVPLHRDAITCLLNVASPAASYSYLLSTSYGGQIRLWRVSNDAVLGSPVLLWEEHENDISLPVMHASVAGRHVAICSFRRYASILCAAHLLVRQRIPLGKPGTEAHLRG